MSPVDIDIVYSGLIYDCVTCPTVCGWIPSDRVSKTSDKVPVWVEDGLVGRKNVMGKKVHSLRSWFDF